MHRLVGFIFALALGVVACNGTGGTEDASANSFIVLRGGIGESYDATWVGLEDQGQQLVLFASNARDPYPDAFDDEYDDNLSVAIDRDALAQISIGQNHTISGEASWPRIELDWVRSSDADFVGNGAHLTAIQSVFFYRSCFGCGAVAGAQTIQGRLNLSVNTASRLAGLIVLRIEGAVPGIFAQQPTTHDVVLVFDLDVAE